MKIIEERDNLKSQIISDLSKLKSFLDEKWQLIGELRVDSNLSAKSTLQYTSDINGIDIYCSVSPKLSNQEVIGYIANAKLIHPLWDGDYVYANCYFKCKRLKDGESYGSLPPWHIWLGHEPQFYPTITKGPENIGRRLFTSLNSIGKQLQRYEQEYGIFNK